MDSQKLVDLIAKTFELNKNDISLSSNRKSISAWDSMGEIHLMLAIEETYDITITGEEFSKMNSVMDIQLYLEKIK